MVCNLTRRDSSKLLVINLEKHFFSNLFISLRIFVRLKLIFFTLWSINVWLFVFCCFKVFSNSFSVAMSISLVISLMVLAKYKRGDSIHVFKLARFKGLTTLKRHVKKNPYVKNTLQYSLSYDSKAWPWPWPWSMSLHIIITIFEHGTRRSRSSFRIIRKTVIKSTNFAQKKNYFKTLNFFNS